MVWQMFDSMSRVPLMPSALVIGVLAANVYGMLFSSPKDCYDNLAECIAKRNLCQKESVFLESMCGIEGGPCQLEDTEVCNMTVQFLFSDISLQSGCSCHWEEKPCTLLHLFASYCQQHSDDVKSSTRTSWTPEPLIPKSAPASVSCLRALQSCQESHDCASAYKTMNILCPVDGTECKSRVASPLCLSLWEELRRSQLGQCTCSQGRRKCLALWHFIHDNPCVHKVLECQDMYMTTKDQNSQRRTPEQKTVPKMKWSDSSLSGYVPGMSRSCSAQMKACLAHEACNRWLVPMVQACPASQCNQSQCGLKIQQFYEGLPQTMAEMLVFCTCDLEDWECQVARTSLHGDICEAEVDWTCSEMMDRCLESTICRERFGALLSNCMGMGPGDTESVISEWQDIMDYELSWSRDRECRMAVVATMGTSLQNPCHCDGLPTHYLHKCNTLHQLLHNKSVFSNRLTITSTPDQFLKANERRHEQWLSYDVLYISMYIILGVAVVVLSVVVIVLHELRVRKKAADQLRYDTPLQKNRSPL